MTRMGTRPTAPGDEVPKAESDHVPQADLAGSAGAARLPKGLSSSLGCSGPKPTIMLL